MCSDKLAVKHNIATLHGDRATLKHLQYSILVFVVFQLQIILFQLAKIPIRAGDIVCSGKGGQRKWEGLVGKWLTGFAKRRSEKTIICTNRCFFGEENGKYKPYYSISFSFIPKNWAKKE